MPSPGDGEDYAGLFAALRAIGYNGDISIEAYAADDPEAQLKAALCYLKTQENA